MMVRKMSAAEFTFAMNAKGQKPAKYRAVPTVVDGIRFDSKAEARRYKELRIIEEAGEITGLRLQPRYELLSAFVDASGMRHRAATYVGDFEYGRRCGSPDGVHWYKTVCEDVKGIETPVFRLKRKLFAAKYPEIRLEVVK